MGRPLRATAAIAASVAAASRANAACSRSRAWRRASRTKGLCAAPMRRAALRARFWTMSRLLMRVAPPPRAATSDSPETRPSRFEVHPRGHALPVHQDPHALFLRLRNVGERAIPAVHPGGHARKIRAEDALGGADAYGERHRFTIEACQRQGLIGLAGVELLLLRHLAAGQSAIGCDEHVSARPGD